MTILNSKIYTLLLLVFIMFSCGSDDGSMLNEDGKDNFNSDHSLNLKAVGSSANDLLSAANYNKIRIEIVYAKDFQPSAETINNFTDFLEERLNKPEGVIITTREIIAPQTDTYSIEEVTALESKERTAFNTRNEIAIWVFFANEKSESDKDDKVVLGTAYRNTSFVIFEKTIQENTSGFFSSKRSMLESAVLLHEFGHILGLTNLGSPMQQPHEDSEHEKHCNVKECLMYWSINSQKGVNAIMGQSNISKLDSQCLADLQANGGK